MDWRGDKGKQRSALLQVRDFIWTALVNGSALTQKKDDVPLSLSGEFAIAGYEFWWADDGDAILQVRSPASSTFVSYLAARTRRAVLFRLLAALEEQICCLTEGP